MKKFDLFCDSVLSCIPRATKRERADIREELLDHLTVLIEEKTIELADSETRQAAQYARMKERVRFMAEHGNASYLSILLASDSFADFLNRWEIVQQISVRDEKLFEQLKAIRDKVSQEKTELEQAQADAQATKEMMDANMAELETQRQAKITAQKKAEDQKASVNKAYADMIEKEEDLMEEYKKAAAKLAAEDLLNQWKEGAATEDSFAALATATAWSSAKTAWRSFSFNCLCVSAATRLAS